MCRVALVSWNVLTTPVDDEIKAFVLRHAQAGFQGPVYCARGDGKKHLDHRSAIIMPCDLSHAS
jgi:hypothetical protein